jgi:hypothetical protein
MASYYMGSRRHYAWPHNGGLHSKKTRPTVGRVGLALPLKGGADSTLASLINSRRTNSPAVSPSQVAAGGERSLPRKRSGLFMAIEGRAERGWKRL